MVDSKLRTTPSQSPGEDGTPLSYDSAQQRGAGPGPIEGRNTGSRRQCISRGSFLHTPVNVPFSLGVGHVIPISA